MNLEVLAIAKICFQWQLMAKIWAAKGMEAERTRQAETERQTDRRSDRDECQSQLRRGLRCMSSFHRSLLPWWGGVCTGLCRRARPLQSLRRRNAPGGSSAWIRTAGFKPLVLCLQTHWLRVKMNSWGLVWLETSERKAREKRKKGRGWVKREKCRRGWEGDLSIGCQIFQRMGAGAHDKSYEASWHQKQDDCKERPYVPGLSLSYLTWEIKKD